MGKFLCVLKRGGQSKSLMDPGGTGTAFAQCVKCVRSALRIAMKNYYRFRKEYGEVKGPPNNCRGAA